MMIELYYINAATDGSLCVARDEIKPTPQNAQALIMIKTLIEGG